MRTQKSKMKFEAFEDGGKICPAKDCGTKCNLCMKYTGNIAFRKH